MIKCIHFPDLNLLSKEKINIVFGVLSMCVKLGGGGGGEGFVVQEI